MDLLTSLLRRTTCSIQTGRSHRSTRHKPQVRWVVALLDFWPLFLSWPFLIAAACCRWSRNRVRPPFGTYAGKLRSPDAESEAEANSSSTAQKLRPHCRRPVVTFEGAYLLTQSIQTHIPYIHPTLMVPIYTDVQSIELNARAVSRKRVCFLPKMRQFPASAAK